MDIKHKPYTPKPCKPELLLPAGSREAFAAAIEGGADAVYLGLDKFNARNRAKNFQLQDLQPLLEVAHQHHRKVYLTLNTLLKNKELIHLAEMIPILKANPPDAIIVQDWGVFSLLHKLLSIPLHGSTQMGFHNSAGVDFAKQAGLSRIILARELTWQELEQIRSKSQFELELFVHGALCYSFSGGCLFSSFTGGMSANRGLCRQPCRRFYTAQNEQQYWFNLKDLQLLERVPDLVKLGITSLKIEGRMKRAEYVYKVAQAYRLALDFPERMEEARAILSSDFGRAKTSYFMQSPLSDSLAEFPFTGILAGYVEKVEADIMTIALQIELKRGDLIRIMPQSGADSDAFSIEDMIVSGHKVQSAKANQILQITHSQSGIQGGEAVFLIDRSDWKQQIKVPYKKPLPYKPLNTAIKNEVAQLTRSKPFSVPQGLYLRMGEPKWLPLIPVKEFQQIFVPFFFAQKAEFSRWYKQYPLRLELPRFIPETALPRYKEEIKTLLAKGFHRFLISHISQLSLFPKNSDIWSNEWVYTLNDASISFLAGQQVTGFIYPLENDIPNLLQYQNKQGIQPLFFHPQLFYARQPVKVKSEFQDADSSYRILVDNGWTIVIPSQPTAIFQHKEKLQGRGFSRFLLDVTYLTPNQDLMNTLLEHFYTGSRWEHSSQFNYKKGLW